MRADAAPPTAVGVSILQVVERQVRLLLPIESFSNSVKGCFFFWIELSVDFTVADTQLPKVASEVEQDVLPGPPIVEI